MESEPKLSAIHQQLRDHHGLPTVPPLDDPFHLILWEQVAYLANDQKRLEAFQLLTDRVGLSPHVILAAPLRLLTGIAATGGSIAPEKRASRMQDSARRVISDWEGDLRKALELPLSKAIRILSQFPMIGKPGAEKILLLTKTHPLLALDSNGLRVLLRLGYGKEESRYDKTYQSVRASTAAQEPADCDEMISLQGLLRLHGQTLCRQNRPKCGGCPLQQSCSYFRGPGFESQVRN